ncbi:protein O-GlcNAcase [Paenibacillus donghaensis]|uniref:Hyaluronidase n=1 Tax=Paenibacillus donghaensis TaxID=414771 RepID=A0A2Z2KFZ5_9BACL|nr:beta-N-acetylglucosaminidase domain-containing protein [Paenibacillus donghaensis]ASA19732.1 hyaluronidase [Paenibacillus donghaensis]
MGIALSHCQYLFRDYYDQGEVLVLDGAQLRCELSSRYAMNQDVEGLLDEGGSLVMLKPRGPGVAADEQGNARLELDYDGSLAADGYRLVIGKDAKIVIAASGRRGLKYGIDALQCLLTVEDGQCRLPVVTVEDEPSFAVRGIIEGFYGTPWSFDDRMDAVRYMADHRMNAFMYAPKDDPYHRELWREPYPDEIFAGIQELKQECDKQLVDFYYCISPGNDLEFRSADDFARLEEKLAAMIAIGVRHFALLMDDIDYVLKGDNKHFLERSGVAHAYVTNKVYEYLAGQLSNFTLAMCPSEYWSYWNTEYKKDMQEKLHPEVNVFWTGYFVFAPEIGRKHAEDNHKYYGHNLWLWDNIPVNDCDRDRLFLDPVRGRYSRLGQLGHTAVVANPMNQWECSKITLTTMAHYMWNSERYMPELSWDLAVREFAGEAAEEMMFFCRQNLNSRLYSGGYEELKQALEQRDLPQLDDYFLRLEQAAQRLGRMDNAKFISEAAPWLRRAEADAALWRAIRRQLAEPQLPEAQEEVRECAALCHSLAVRLGSDPAMRAAEALGIELPEPPIAEEKKG